MLNRIWQWFKAKWFLLHLDNNRARELFALDPLLVKQVLHVMNDPVLMSACQKARHKALTDSAYSQANEWLWDAEVAEWTRTYLREIGYDCSRAKAWFIAAATKYREKEYGD